WKDKLAGNDSLLELPIDKPRPTVQSYQSAIHNIRLEPGTVRNLRELGQHHSCTLFVALLATLQATLSRVCTQSDVRVGTVVSGRTRVETESVAGFFVNTLVLRTQIAPRATFTDLLRDAMRTMQEAQAHQNVAFERVVESLQPERLLNHNPL